MRYPESWAPSRERGREGENADPRGKPNRDCGYSHASTPVIQKALKARTADGAHPLVDAVALQEFSDPRQSVREDVAFLRTNPLVHPDSMVSGWYYSVKTGELQRVC